MENDNLNNLSTFMFRGAFAKLETHFTFYDVKTGVILQVSEQGFEYKGELIDDAGACYAAMMEFLNRVNAK